MFTRHFKDPDEEDQRKIFLMEKKIREVSKEIWTGESSKNSNVQTSSNFSANQKPSNGFVMNGTTYYNDAGASSSNFARTQNNFNHPRNNFQNQPNSISYQRGNFSNGFKDDKNENQNRKIPDWCKNFHKRFQ